MKSKLLYRVLLLWTALTVLVNLYSAFTAQIGGSLILLLVMIEIATCWVTYKLIKERKWALITLIIYYGLRSINIYTYDIKFYTKSGLNIELWLDEWISLNIVSVIFFLLLAVDLYKKNQVGTPLEAENLSN